MKRWNCILLITVLAIILAGSGCQKKAPHTKDIILTKENHNFLAKNIDNYSEISTEEARLFLYYMFDSMKAAVINKTKPTYIGKTVGKVIDEERKIEKTTK